MFNIICRIVLSVCLIFSFSIGPISCGNEDLASSSDSLLGASDGSLSLQSLGVSVVKNVLGSATTNWLEKIPGLSEILGENQQTQEEIEQIEQGITEIEDTLDTIVTMLEQQFAITLQEFSDVEETQFDEINQTFDEQKDLVHDFIKSIQTAMNSQIYDQF